MIGPDGKFRIEVPYDLPPGQMQAVVIPEGAPDSQHSPSDTLDGMLYGIADPDFDLDAVLCEMNELWRGKGGADL